MNKSGSQRICHYKPFSFQFEDRMIYIMVHHKNLLNLFIDNLMSLVFNIVFNKIRGDIFVKKKVTVLLNRV